MYDTISSREAMRQRVERIITSDATYVPRGVVPPPGPSRIAAARQALRDDARRTPPARRENLPHRATRELS